MLKDFIVPRSLIHILRQNIQHRSLVVDLIRRDFKLRYQGSLIGSYWNLLHPIAMIAIYTVIFSKLMHSRLGVAISVDSPFLYTFYLCAGLLPWSSFVEMVNRGTKVYLDNSSLIKKVTFPMEILLPMVAGSASINFFISMTIYTLLLVFSGFGITPYFLLIPVIFVIQSIFALGLSMFLSVLNVFFRDMEQIVNIVFQIWFWLTPIVYLQEQIPEGLQYLLYFNPMFLFARIYQEITVFKIAPNVTYLVIVFGIALLTAFLGASFLCRLKNEIPDEI